MSLLKIVHLGDPVLRKKAVPVTEFDQNLRTLIHEMFKTMYAAPGVGLAANQVGRLDRVVVIDVQPGEKSRPLVLINPVIETSWGKIREDEGCLSIPSFSARVYRAQRTRVRALNEKGLPIMVEGEGLLSRALQHEIDHLNGKLYIDHLSFFQRLKIKREFAKHQKRK